MVGTQKQNRTVTDYSNFIGTIFRTIKIRKISFVPAFLISNSSVKHISMQHQVVAVWFDWWGDVSSAHFNVIVVW